MSAAIRCAATRRCRPRRVSELAVAAGQPRNRSPHHRPVLPVDGLEPRTVACRRAPRSNGSFLCSHTVLPFATVVHVACGGQSRQAVPKTTSQNLLIGRVTPARGRSRRPRLVDDEAVDGKAAGHRRPQRQRLDQRLVAGLGERRA